MENEPKKTVREPKKTVSELKKTESESKEKVIEPRRIVIMGATSGIGLAVAERLLADGCRLGIAGRNAESLRQLEQRWPGQVVYSEIDITEDKAVGRLEDLISRLGGMDTYFHISGVGYENSTMATPPEVRTMETNVTGFVRMMSTAYRYFRSHGGKGHIAAITSVAGTKGVGRLAAYSTSKRAQQTYLVALEQLANEQGLSIRFSDIRPGWVRTPLLAEGKKYPMLMSVDYAADRIIRGLHRRVTVVDWRWGILSALWRLIPNRLWVHMRLNTNLHLK